MEKRLSNHKTVVGLLLIVAGFSLLYFLTPLAISSSLLATFILVWIVVSLIGLSVFLILHLELKHYAKSLLIALAVLIPWNAIFFIPLPGNSQFLLAVFVALIGVLSYRYYLRRKSETQTR